MTTRDAPARIRTWDPRIMAGNYARTDWERGVHKAPANVVVRGIDRIQR